MTGSNLPIKLKLFLFFLFQLEIRCFENERGLTSARPMSTRPPSALAGGTATRLTSALHTNTTVPNQRIGTAIGFAETVSHEHKIYTHSLLSATIEFWFFSKYREHASPTTTSLESYK